MVVNFSWLIENEIAGSAFPHLKSDIDFYYSQGIRAIVTLTASKPQFMDRIEQLNINHLHLPIIDFSVPYDKDIYTYLNFIEQNLPKNPVLVHCYAGIGRTGTMLALYLVWFKNLSGEDAINYVRHIRNPSIETLEQEDLVQSFANNIDYHREAYKKYFN